MITPKPEFRMDDNPLALASSITSTETDGVEYDCSQCSVILNNNVDISLSIQGKELYVIQHQPYFVR